MWKGACVGVYQLLNWKMHGETLKLFTLSSAGGIGGCLQSGANRLAGSPQHEDHDCVSAVLWASPQDDPLQNHVFRWGPSHVRRGASPHLAAWQYLPALPGLRFANGHPQRDPLWKESQHVLLPGVPSSGQPAGNHELLHDFLYLLHVLRRF